MKELFPLALIAIFSLLSQNSYSQSIVLINGQPTKVVLKGTDIESIVNHNINEYLKDYGQEPEGQFQFAKLRQAEKIESLKADTNSHSEKSAKDNHIASAVLYQEFESKIDK